MTVGSRDGDCGERERFVSALDSPRMVGDRGRREHGWKEQVVRVFGGGGTQIGVSIRDFNDDELKAGKATTGVVVEDVEADSPAQKAGFKAGDIVVEFDGERVRSTRQFMRLVQETVAGRSVQAAVDARRPARDAERAAASRAGRSSSSTARATLLSAMPKPKVAPPMVLKRDGFPPDFESLIGAAGQLGISVDELSPQLSEYFGTKEGVLVTTVRDNSNASKAGVKAGDVITSLERRHRRRPRPICDGERSGSKAATSSRSRSCATRSR